jgi:hypothetical protein
MFFFLNIYGQNTIVLKSGTSTLSIIKETDRQYYPRVEIENPDSFYHQPYPVSCEIITSTDSAYWIHMPYSSVSHSNDTITCISELLTQAGSKIRYTDIYSKTDTTGNFFEIRRLVEILEASEGDKGFSSRLTFSRDIPSSLNEYDFFVPAIWYKDNKYVTNRALASDYSDNDFWFREDRLPLPIMMLREKSSGITFSLAHIDPDGNTFKEERGSERIIDERLKFASIGLKNNKHPEIGITYPGSEGERTYVSGRKDERRWAYRSHPVKAGFEHSYKMCFRLTNEGNYAQAIKNTWDIYYSLFSPSIYLSDLNEIYHQQIVVLDKYWKSINGAAGVPFRVLLNGEIESENDYNYNIGFVGQQPGNASLLIREGLRTKNEELLSKGEQMADFWANNCVTSNGCPRTWYDPYPQTWRGPEVALREIGDGMIGLLRAWNYEQIYERDEPEWLSACVKVADWIVAGQQNDGSFYSHFDYNTGKPTKTFTNCTSHIIPFLSEMYFATGKDGYKRSALLAGEYIYSDIMNDFKYVGGAIDNPNVMDKESASMALRAFLALYDIQNEQKWMDALLQTAYFYRTWVVCWDIPISADDEKAVFPAHRSVVGQSVIATGHSGADTYAAIDALGFYRAYLYSGDEQLLHFSKLLLHNTKQFMNWDKSDPIPWIAEGLFGEAMNISIPRGHGVNYYLPWATYNQLEPLVFLEDIFGFKDISDIENMPETEKLKMHEGYSKSRLYNK